MNKAELREQVEAMTEEEAADAVLVYAPDWPDKITPIAEVIARRRGAEAGGAVGPRAQRVGAEI